MICPEPGDARARRQREFLSEDPAGCEERDLKTSYLHDEQARGRHGVEEGGFAVLLLGRDGGEKLRANEPITAAELFESIDRMPMRRCEMREQAREQMRERETD